MVGAQGGMARTVVDDRLFRKRVKTPIVRESVARAVSVPVGARSFRKPRGIRHKGGSTKDKDDVEGT